MLGPVMIVGLIAFTAPTLAQQQVPLTDPGPMVVQKQVLLREAPCIEGQEARLTSERVSSFSPRVYCDRFREPILRRLDALVILGTLAGAAAGNLLLGRLRRSASA
jgi:hypothetical protein